MMSSDIKLKVVLAGSHLVGKSSIVSNILRRDFDSECPATIGAAFFTQNIQIVDRTINLQIWDTVTVT